MVRSGGIPRGVEFGDRASLDMLLAEVRAAKMPDGAAPLIDGAARAGAERPVVSPVNGQTIGRVREGDAAVATAAMAAAQSGFASWASNRSSGARRRSNVRAISSTRAAPG